MKIIDENEDYFKKMELLKRFGGNRMILSGGIYFNDYVSRRRLRNIRKCFSKEINSADIIGIWDKTVLKSAREGIVFTINCLYYKEILELPIKVKYKDIQDVELIDVFKNTDGSFKIVRFPVIDADLESDPNNPDADDLKKIRFHMKDGEVIEINDYFLDMYYLKKYVLEMITMV